MTDAYNARLGMEVVTKSSRNFVKSSTSVLTNAGLSLAADS